MYIRHDTPFVSFPLTTDLNAIAIRLRFHTLLTVCSVYLPPNRSISIFELRSLISQLPAPFVLLGDFNARNQFWFDSTNNTKGRLLLAVIQEFDLVILNDPSPTHYHQQSDSFSVIDLSICSPDFPSDRHWHVHDDLCGSDHYPLLLHVLPLAPVSPRPHWVYRRADWPAFELASRPNPALALRGRAVRARRRRRYQRR